MAEMVFNERAFYNHLGGDVELGYEILKVYLVDAPDRLDSLKESVHSGDLDLIVKYSHALKGISATVRAEGIALLAEKVELAARKGEVDVIRDYLPQVVGELDNVLEAVRAHLSGNVAE
ncbi:Hpt domain-containing protein [Maridesulfovibrio sp.]|uniref:Hpt domain-containing protein n=1 Tax=unclassified Maridesulfovibrio TaxID=2794999 RepID=UPI003B004535